MCVPDWVQDSVFYQIFPDRFANGDPSNDPQNVQPWEAKPTKWSFHGGDLRGIIQKLDYLSDLGVNAIYLNPVFRATSNHRYDTIDYYTIDPKLGSIDDFRELVRKIHERGMRIILDGVFNHSGRGFFAFLDIMENQQHSAYLDWYHIKRFPLEAYKRGVARSYLAWWKIKSLPKFNTDNPFVRQHLFDVARFWMEQGIDGWRLDVPNEIDDDDFWGEFRQVVKQANSQAYLLGEIWQVDPRWVGRGHFDGLMNYPLRKALLELLGDQTGGVDGFIHALGALLSAYPRENTFAHYLPAGTHDTPRLATILKQDRRKMKLFYLVLLCFPGAPAIYYGDEIGMEGGEDPDCRRAFPWSEDQWDHDLRDFLKELIRFRGSSDVLRRGAMGFLPGEPGGVAAMSRTLDGKSVVMAFNATNAAMDCELPVARLGWTEPMVIKDILSRNQYVVSEGSLRVQLSPYQGLLLDPQV